MCRYVLVLYCISCKPIHLCLCAAACVALRILSLQEKACELLFFFFPLTFECSIGVSSSANTVYYSLTLVLCTAVTSTLACKQTQPSSFPFSSSFSEQALCIFPTCITKSAHALLMHISASLLAFYGVGIMSEKHVVIAMTVFCYGTVSFCAWLNQGKYVCHSVVSEFQ